MDQNTEEALWELIEATSQHGPHSEEAYAVGRKHNKNKEFIKLAKEYYKESNYPWSVWTC